MKFITILIALLFFQVPGYCQNKESDLFINESKTIQKDINWIILKVADQISESCDHAVVYLIFIQDIKKTKFKVAGDDPRIIKKIKIDPVDSVMVNWSAINSRIQNQVLIQPVVFKCDAKEYKDIMVSVNNFNAILSSIQESRKNKITLLDPMIIDVGITMH